MNEILSTALLVIVFIFILAISRSKISEAKFGAILKYFSLYFDGRISSHWTLSGGLTSTAGDGADALLFDLGLRYGW